MMCSARRRANSKTSRRAKRSGEMRTSTLLVSRVSRSPLIGQYAKILPSTICPYLDALELFCLFLGCFVQSCGMEHWVQHDRRWVTLVAGYRGCNRRHDDYGNILGSKLSRSIHISHWFPRVRAYLRWFLWFHVVYIRPRDSGDIFLWNADILCR